MSFFPTMITLVWREGEGGGLLLRLSAGLRPWWHVWALRRCHKILVNGPFWMPEMGQNVVFQTRSRTIWDAHASEMRPFGAHSDRFSPVENPVSP